MSLEDEVKKQKAKNRILKNKGKPQKVYNLVKDYSDNDGKPKGNPTCICKRCKKEFEQDYVPDRNAYTDWKTCGPCRKLLAEEKSKTVTKTEKEVSVAKLPYTPYNWQIEAQEAFEKHRFIVLACGNRCFLEGDFINGADKFVEDLTEEDLTIDKNGKFQDIVQISTMPYDGDVYTIKGVGMEPIRLSENHPVWITTIKDGTKEIVKSEFVNAKDIETYISKLNDGHSAYLKIEKCKSKIDCRYWKFDRLKGGRGQIDGITIDEDIAWMLGLYCAEGCYLGKGGCKWTLNYNEPELADRLCSILDRLSLHYNIRERSNSGTRCVIVTKMQFCRRIDKEVGHGSKNKKIPCSILYNSNIEILISFLKGYYAGDGWFGNNPERLETITVSKTLSQQLQSAFCILGGYAKITSYQRKQGKKKKDGTFGVSNREYKISISEVDIIRKLGYEARDKKKTNPSVCIKHKDAIYVPIKSISCEREITEIYAITTEDGTIVSNNIELSNSGKDRFTIMAGIKYFIECLNENRALDNLDMVPPVLWWQLAPTEKMAKQNWRELKQYFPKEWIVACSDSSYQMETIGGGIIEVRSGYDPDSLVGVGLDLVTITEAARFKDLNLAWANLEARLNSPGRGRAKDRAGRRFGQGKAIINSSPLGKNDFYDMFCYGKKSHPNYSSIWWSAQYPWTCNPVNAELANTIVQTKYGPLTYEESLRRQIGERTFRSNYLADFLAEDSTVFKNFEEKCVLNIYDQEKTGLKTKKERDEFIQQWKSPIPGESYICGYDPATGSSSDSPVMIMRHKNTGRVVRVYDMYGKDYQSQFNFIESMCKIFNYAEVHWLRTGHTAIESQFERRGLVEVPIDEQGQNKGKLVQTLEIAIENGDVHILMDGSTEIQTLIYQMNDYTEKNGKYSNDKMPHDDYVSAMYAAFSDYAVFDFKIGYCGIFGSL